MKKIFVLCVVMLACMTFFAWSEDADFTGFEGRALSVAEARLVSGGETYVGYTRAYLWFYHTFIVVTDKPITNPSFTIAQIYESGSEHSVFKSFFSSAGLGNNIKRTYNKVDEVKANPKKYYLEQVTPAKGMSIKEYDSKVVAVAEAHFRKPPKKYSVWENSCNTTTSAILSKSGGYFKPSGYVPGWRQW